MKKHFLVLWAFVCLFVSCEKEDPLIDKVLTGAATDITLNSVVLHGVVNVDIMQYNNVEFGMMVATSEAALENDDTTYPTEVLLGNNFEVQISSLTPNTKYYYCAYIVLNGTTHIGSIMNFDTLASTDDQGNTENPEDNPKDNPDDNPSNPYLTNIIGKWVEKKYSTSTPEYYYFLLDGQGYKEKFVENDGIEYRPITWKIKDTVISITWEDNGYYGEITSDYAIIRCDEDSLKLGYNKNNNIFSMARINKNGTTTTDYLQSPYTSYLRAYGIYYPLTKAVMKCYHSTGTESNDKFLYFFGNNGSLTPTGVRFMYFTPYYEGINKEWYDGTYTIQSKSGYWIYGGAYWRNGVDSYRCDGKLTIKTVGNIKHFDFVLGTKAIGHFEGTWSYN